MKHGKVRVPKVPTEVHNAKNRKWPANIPKEFNYTKFTKVIISKHEHRLAFQGQKSVNFGNPFEPPFGGPFR